jgi:hypothetical protein
LSEENVSPLEFFRPLRHVFSTQMYTCDTKMTAACAVLQYM